MFETVSWVSENSFFFITLNGPIQVAHFIVECLKDKEVFVFDSQLDHT